MKVLRINDDLHKKIKYLAESDRRTINTMAEMLLEQAIDGTPSSENTPLPKNYNVKKLEDGTVTKANPDDPYFAYSSPLSNLPDNMAADFLKNSGASTVSRTKGEVLAEIRSTEADRDEALRYSQDEEYAASLRAKYAVPIQRLWDEYNLIKGDE